MNTYWPNLAYRIGLAGAALSMLYTIHIVWLHETGRSLFLTPDRYVSREDMLATIGIGMTMTLLSWGAGAAARYFLKKRAVARPSNLPRESVEHRN